MTNDIATYGKVPPQAPEAENALLGILLLQGDDIELVFQFIETGDTFYNSDNQKIFDAMLGVYNSGSKVDSITVCEQLKKDGETDARKWINYTIDLTMKVVNGAHVVKYAQIVKEKYLMRELIRACIETLNQAYDDTVDIFDLIDSHSVEIDKLGDVNGAEYPTSIQKAATDEVMRIHNRIEMGIEFDGVPTGYSRLDKVTGGWQDTDLIILAARPAVGKTALTLNLALNAAECLDQEINVAFFSLEMSKSQLAQRALAIRSGVDFGKIHKEVLSIEKHELEKIERTANNFNKCRLFINDRAAINPNYVKRVSTALHKKHGLSMIIIDYLQLMSANVKIKGNREQEVSSISRDLKTLAKDLKVPIIALSQLNRDVTGEPDLRNLRESGAIEQDADVVMFIYNPDDKNKNEKVLTIKKHRNGDLAEIPFIFEGSKQLFAEPVMYYEGVAPPVYDNPRAGINTSKPYNEDDNIPI